MCLSCIGDFLDLRFRGAEASFSMEFNYRAAITSHLEAAVAPMPGARPAVHGPCHPHHGRSPEINDYQLTQSLPS